MNTYIERHGGAWEAGCVESLNRQCAGRCGWTLRANTNGESDIVFLTSYVCSLEKL